MNKRIVLSDKIDGCKVKIDNANVVDKEQVSKTEEVIIPDRITDSESVTKKKKLTQVVDYLNERASGVSNEKSGDELVKNKLLDDDSDDEVLAKKVGRHLTKLQDQVSDINKVDSDDKSDTLESNDEKIANDNAKVVNRNLDIKTEAVSDEETLPDALLPLTVKVKVENVCEEINKNVPSSTNIETVHGNERISIKKEVDEFVGEDVDYRAN